MGKKTTCPISRKDFLAHAKPLAIKIGEIPQSAGAREFSTGSLGWYLNAKTTIDVNGIPVAVQVGMNITVVGSKELPKDPSAPHAAPHAEPPA
jgi:hypothetical protein